LTVTSLSFISAAICLFSGPVNDQGQDLALAWAQQLVAGLKVTQFFGLLPPHPIAFERDAHGIEQGLLAHRLGEEFDHAGLHRPDAHGNIAMAGDENSWNVRVRACELGLPALVRSNRQPQPSRSDPAIAI